MIRACIIAAALAALTGCIIPTAHDNDPTVFHSTMAPEAATECIIAELARENDARNWLRFSVAPKRGPDRQLGTITVREILSHTPEEDRSIWTMQLGTDQDDRDWYRVSIYPESTGSMIEMRIIFNYPNRFVVPMIEACGGQAFAAGIS